MVKKPGSREPQAFGYQGESFAAQFLQQQGLEILSRNFRTRWGELDLIARDGNELVFVEVKTRHDDQAGYPEEAVGRHKVRSLMRAAWIYTEKHPDSPQAWRIDVVAIQWNNNKPLVRWFKNISSQFD